MKTFLIVCALAGCFIKSYAQRDLTKALRIGDTVRELHFENLINTSSKSMNLSSLKGTPVILDYWATWCIPCIKAFPTIEQIQNKFSGKIKFILVGMDSKENVRKYYQMNPQLKLTSDIAEGKNNDHYLLFPHTTIPYYVWLDKDHVVRLTSGHGSITEENVRQFLQGKTPDVPIKDGVAQAKAGNYKTVASAATKRSMENPDTITVFKSELTRSYDRLKEMKTKHRYLPDQYGGTNSVIDISGYSLYKLYALAFGMATTKNETKFKYYQVLLETKDSLAIDPSLTTVGSKYKNFVADTYNYQLVLPKNEKDSTKRFKLMQTALLNAFPYTAAIENRETPCIVLSAIGPNIISGRFDSVITKITTYGVELKGMSLDYFLSIYQHFLNGYDYGTRKVMPVINETNWEGPVELNFRVKNMADLTELNAQLRKYNLKMSVGLRSLPMVVIKDRL